MEIVCEFEVKFCGGFLFFFVEVIEVCIIGFIFGVENICCSLVVVFVGLVLVVVFMLVVYCLLGVVVVMVFSFYVLFNLVVYVLILVIFILLGIVGFIFLIGMVVDVNVLIFEWIKDELCWGNILICLIDIGFFEVFLLIVDGYLIMLISCVVFFFFGIGLVKGFVVILGIGVLLSLFMVLICICILFCFLMGYVGLCCVSNFLFIG